MNVILERVYHRTYYVFIESSDKTNIRLFWVTAANRNLGIGLMDNLRRKFPREDQNKFKITQGYGRLRYTRLPEHHQPK